MRKFILLTSVVILVSGCDGMVSVKGWVLESSEANGSSLALKEERPIEPTKGIIKDAWVELWTADGSYRLERCEAKTGDFCACHVGLYTPGMRYMVRAGAPGRVPLEQIVRLQKYGNWAIIRLAPVKKPEIEEQIP